MPLSAQGSGSLGALLAAGYASAVSAAIASAPNGQQITDSVQNQLTKSFSSAEAIAGQYPEYSGAITAAAKSSFLDGANWAYLAGIVAILIGAALVYLLFPTRETEKQLLADYHAQDTRATPETAASDHPGTGDDGGDIRLS